MTERKSRAVLPFSLDQRKPVSQRATGKLSKTWNTYDPKNAIPVPFRPNQWTQRLANPKYTAVQARSLKRKMLDLPFASMIKPIGQVITWSVVPRQIQRRIPTAATNLTL